MASAKRRSMRLQPWSLKYIYLKLVVTLMRSLVSFLRGLGSIVPLLRPKISPLPDSFERKLIRIPSRDPGRTIRAFIHRPKKASGKPLPVHINFHGSGFILPNLGEDNVFVHHALTQLGPECVVIDADYRKAPEWPFPEPVYDAEDVVNFVLSQPDVYDARRISLGGFSAGGNLALVAATLVGPEKICAVTSMYPVTDFTIRAHLRAVKSQVRPDSGFPLPAWFSRLFSNCYFVTDKDRQSPLCSVYKKDPSSFPPILLASGEVDTLYFDSEKLVQKLQQAGKRAEFIPIEKEGHGFDKLTMTPQSIMRREKVYTAFTDFIRQSWPST